MDPTRNRNRILLTILVSATLALAAPAAAQGEGDDAEITVTFSNGGMTVSIHSTKDISNVIVEDCPGDTHKHDGLDGNWFNHTETFVIAAVWVKSGNNHDDGPPGSGERFENEDADCDEEPPCVDDTQTPADECDETEPPCVDDVSTPEDECDTTEPPCVDDQATPEDECDETEIPFFPGFTSVALGSLAVIGSVGYILRRRS